MKTIIPTMFMKKNKLNYVIIFLSILFISPDLFPQTVYSSTTDGIYKYLNDMSIKGYINFDNSIQPLSRKYLLQKIKELDVYMSKLNEIDSQLKDFYQKEFGLELNLDRKISDNEIYWVKDKYRRFRLLSYSSDLFKINVDPILGISFGKFNGNNVYHRWNGLKFYGYLNSSIVFSFYFRDNLESTTLADFNDKNTPATGIITTRKDINSLEYDDVRVNISYDWKWGQLSVGKDFLNWGYGENGKVVLSNKTPSFPNVKLDIYPTPWLKFNYMHGWLKSNLVDSLNIRGQKETYRNKFIAFHSISIIPSKKIEFSLGESIVYSDQLEFSYLIPIMFFRLADHYLANSTNTFGGNAQFFFSMSFKNIIKNVNFYTDLFIDDITIPKILKSNNNNKVGYTLGLKTVDLPIQNIYLNIEYTKVVASVYEHSIEGQDYKSSGYYLGHWIGSNADMIFSSINYRFSRELQATLWGQYIRKGFIANNKLSNIPPSFLSGLRTSSTFFGIDIKYEFIHELFARAKFLYHKISSEQTNGTFIDNSTTEFNIAVYYGL